MAVSRLVSPQSHLTQYAMVFGNTGFIRIPIVDRLYGAQSVVYMAFSTICQAYQGFKTKII
ncbi:hypothetical protein SAG0136_05680 [Streptococcus agalactiae LMG 14747]|uniref:Uncharacterized protein n=1 Tax=Streptococcus agalactiae LMG 14747 TaxID=1154860 RepID=V6Z1X0_STRAG|nr:hypothetical protein SAG0136_05680 [Streptococcus agalactiae LMG 14747]